MSPKLVHKGSVKDIFKLTENELLFRYSDRYSIFDWGEMPDAIPQKGAALAQMGISFFEIIKKNGINTHFLRAGELENEMVVSEVTVPRGNVELYQKSPTNILIPLEVIYRFGAPKGSSLLRRFKTKEDWIKNGYSREYREGEIFSEIKIDFTTKLERIDRTLTPKEAKDLSGMSDSEWGELLQKTQKIAELLKKRFHEVGFVLWDGKFEFAFDSNRKVILVDSIGLDEMRLTFEGTSLSKELLRQAYLGTSWYRAMSEAKLKSSDQFKEICINELKETPQPLPSALITALSRIYLAVSRLISCEDRVKIEELHQQIRADLKVFQVDS